MDNLFTINSVSESGHYRAVIEIPAGTNRKMEINKASGAFEPSLRNGKPRLIDFLPYPINYGFVPGTLMDKERGGDGDPLDVLLICESLPMGTLIEFLPVAVLRLSDTDELDSKILAVPVNPELRTICATNYHELNEWYSAIKEIILIWFLNYDKRNDTTQFIKWDDDQLAIEEIEKWRRIKE